MPSASVATPTGNAADMPPSTALKLLGFWDAHRRQRFQCFVKSTAPMCSGNEDLVNRILSFVAGQPGDLIIHYTDIVLYAAARKLVAAIDLNLDLLTVGADVNDDVWLEVMKTAAYQYKGNMPPQSDFAPARADNMALFGSGTPEHLALGPLAQVPDSPNPLFDGFVADFSAGLAPLAQPEWLLQQPVVPFLAPDYIVADVANMGAGSPFSQQEDFGLGIALPTAQQNVYVFPGMVDGLMPPNDQ